MDQAIRKRNTAGFIIRKRHLPNVCYIFRNDKAGQFAAEKRPFLDMGFGYLPDAISGLPGKQVFLGQGRNCNDKGQALSGVS